MGANSNVIKTTQGWFVETQTGTFGPLDSETEAAAYISLMLKVNAAGNETACIDAECFL